MVKRVPDLVNNIPDLPYFVLASLEELLSGTSEHYSYDKPHSKAVKDPILICHTSGSTGQICYYQPSSSFKTDSRLGAPKPITLPNGAFSIDNHRRLSKLEGRETIDYSLFDLDGKSFINTVLGFYVSKSHAVGHESLAYQQVGGIVAITAFPIWYNSHVIMVPSDRPAKGI